MHRPTTLHILLTVCAVGAAALWACGGLSGVTSQRDDSSVQADAGDAPSGVSMIPAMHRAIASPCTQPRLPGMPGPQGCTFIGVYVGADAGTCMLDQECTSGPNGRCNCTNLGSAPVADNQCSYDQCSSDTDCNYGVCICRENPINVDTLTGQPAGMAPTGCLSGNCRTDSDCGTGRYCSPSPQPGCGATYWHGYFCHTAGDECVNNSDCLQGNAYCAYQSGVGHWICSTGMCPDG